MPNSNQLLRSFIAQTLLESKDHEEEIMRDFLQTDMYKKIARLIENFQYNILESKDPENVINSKHQVSKVHMNLSNYFSNEGIASAEETARRYDALHELSRAANNKNFHEREKSIHDFLGALGIALEAAPFLFILIYLFNTNNPALVEWCDSIDGLTLTAGFAAFASMFLFGEKLRSVQKKKANFHDKAAKFYADEEEKARDNLKPYLSQSGRFSLKDNK